MNVRSYCKTSLICVARGNLGLIEVCDYGIYTQPYFKGVFILTIHTFRHIKRGPMRGFFMGSVEA